MNEHCGTCKFWFYHDGPSGECHRYAPKPRMYSELHMDPDTVCFDTNTAWPDTRELDVCGEWKIAS
jgi:hypothetical protein